MGHPEQENRHFNTMQRRFLIKKFAYLCCNNWFQFKDELNFVYATQKTLDIKTFIHPVPTIGAAGLVTH